MDLADIQKNYPEISAAANDVLGLLDPKFMNKTEGHVETDISAAASLAGLSILRSKGFDFMCSHREQCYCLSWTLR